VRSAEAGKATAQVAEPCAVVNAWGEEDPMVRPAASAWRPNGCVRCKAG